MEGRKAFLQALCTRPAQAYLISGPREDTVQDALHQAEAILLCEAQPAQSRPCGVCAGCRLREANAHPDLCVLLPEEKRKTIGVDTVRDFVGEVFAAPVRRKGRVASIPDGAALTVAAQNALLKTLEEPPEGTVFLLCGQESAFLPTVRSRCVSVYLGDEDGASDAPPFCAEYADAAKALLSGKPLDRANDPKDRAALDALLEGMEWFFRDAVAAHLGQKTLYDSQASAFAGCDLGALIGCVRAAQEARLRAAGNANVKLTLDRLEIEVRRADPSHRGRSRES